MMKYRRAHRVLATAAIATLAAALVATMSSTAFAANPVGALSGTVSAPGITKGDRIKVLLSEVDTRSSQEVAQTYADGTGRYRFDQLPAGSYQVAFLDTSKRYARQSYGGFDQATSLTVSPARTAAVPKVTMTRAASISGVVSGPRNAGPTVNPELTVYKYSAAEKTWQRQYPWTSGLSEDLFDQTDNIVSQPDGSYSITNLAPGSYRLAASAPRDLSSTFYPSAVDMSSATTLTVKAGNALTGKIITLRADIAHPGRSARAKSASTATAQSASATAALAGTVVTPKLPSTDHVTARLFRLRCVDTPFPDDPNCTFGAWVWAPVTSVTATAAGGYRFGGLDPTATYKLGFLDSAGLYAEQWVGLEAYDLTYASTMRVTAGRTTMAPTTTLSRSGTISGVAKSDHLTFTNPRVTVQRYTAGSGWLDWYDDDHEDAVLTSANGAFAIKHLPAGHYRVGIDDHRDLATWYPSSASASRSTVVTVKNGATTALGKPVQLLKGITISGKVTGPGLDGASNASLVAQKWNATTRRWDSLPTQYANGPYFGDAGRYSLGPLPAGTYRVGCAASGHATRFFPGSSLFTKATTFTVKDGDTKTGVDVLLPALG